MLFSVFIFAQVNDSIQPLTEVVVIGQKKDINLKQAKPLATLDEYLQQSGNITMIKRGAYAWEPVINSMATERTLITIDGMHIFGACTDKMDPITSYVEVSNLTEATVISGQHGSGFGATIGGAVDLKRNRSDFKSMGWKTSLSSGFETNSRQKILGTAINYSGNHFFIDTDVMYRNADNYNAGNNQEVFFSKFNKLNISGTTGFKIDKNKIVEAAVIYDKATNVGYPALPMDVSLAEALITSARLEVKPQTGLASRWETKLYYNSVSHFMDDTQRSQVAIHMDMPGRTKTYGGYSTVAGKLQKHQFSVNLNAFYNISDAEMTMYPENSNENVMFMLTWPNVHTIFSGIFLEDNYELTCHSVLKVSGSAGYHSNSVASRSGLESMQIFYPNMPKKNDRILKSLAASYSLKKTLDFNFGAGYGERAPSVSEGYGFYLFNSFENYDYVGNPSLNNEKAIEGNISIGLKNEKISAKISSSYFHINDYIVGKLDASLVPMTIGANGIKIYTALPFATIFNANAQFAYRFYKNLVWQSQLRYSKGRDDSNKNLPFISPFSYTSSLSFRRKDFSCELMLQGNTIQNEFASEYGEDNTPAYAILNLNAGYLFRINSYRLHTKIGVENMLDAYYSTFGDWNNIPRIGRDFFLNLVFQN